MAKLPQGFSRLPSGSIRWRVSVNGRSASGTAPTLAEARRDRAQAALDAGATPTAARMTVAELVDVWLAEVDHTHNTARRRDGALAVIPVVFMARQVRDVSPAVVAALWRQMESAGIGAHTIDKARNALSAAFALGGLYGLATSNPVRAAAYNPPQADEINPPSPDVVKAIIAAADTERPPVGESKHARKANMPARPTLATYFRLMATIGARPGELCALRWDNFDRATNVLRITENVGRDMTMTEGKNDRRGWRDVTLDLPTATRLARVERRLGTPWIFERNGRPWRPEYPSLEFRRICTRLGIDGVRLYSMRHFAATQAILAGVPITEVARMLGDRADTVMRVYAHWIDGPSNAAAAVARALDGA